MTEVYYNWNRSYDLRVDSDFQPQPVLRDALFAAPEAMLGRFTPTYAHAANNPLRCFDTDWCKITTTITDPTAYRRVWNAHGSLPQRRKAPERRPGEDCRKCPFSLENGLCSVGDPDPYRKPTESGAFPACTEMSTINATLTSCYQGKPDEQCSGRKGHWKFDVGINVGIQKQFLGPAAASNGGADTLGKTPSQQDIERYQAQTSSYYSCIAHDAHACQ